MTINQLAQDRKRAFKELKRTLKPVDTTVERIERKIEAVIQRRNKVPEEEDLLEVLNGANEILDLVDTLISVAGNLSDSVFGMGPWKY